MAMTAQLTRCWSGASCSRPLLSSIRPPGESLRQQRHSLHVRKKYTLLARAAVEGENQRPPEQRKDVALLSQENDDMECIGTGMDVECVLPDVIAKEENKEMDCIGTGLDVECVLPDGSSKTRAKNLSVSEEEASLVESVLSTLLLISPFFFWGTAMVAMKGILPKAGPMFVAATRLIPAGALLIGFARYV